MEFTRPHALATTLAVALLVATLSSAGAAQTPLVTFRPGAPDEPRWTVIELIVPPEGATPKLTVRFEHARCPLTWGFLFLQGPPEDARIVSGITFDFATGQGGYVVYADGSWPVALNESDMSQNGEEWCYGGPTWNIQLGRLPAGQIHLLQFTAGIPFSAQADLFFNVPVQVGAASRGGSSHYIRSTDFRGEMHVAAYSPPAFEGFCNPSCAWSGGEWGVADVGKDRAASVTFAHRPYFAMRNPSTVVDVSRATVTDPQGAVMESGSFLLPDIAGYRLYPFDIEVTSTSNLPAGEYEFAIDLNAGASTGAVGWHVYAVDFEFPQEQQARLAQGP